MTKINNVVLLVEHQSGLTNIVQDFSPYDLNNNVKALADATKYFHLPTNDPKNSDSDGGVTPDGEEALNGNGAVDEGESDPVTAVKLSDLDGNGTIDTADYYIFLGAFGICEGQAGFNAECGSDGDNCITFVDYGSEIIQPANHFEIQSQDRFGRDKTQLSLRGCNTELCWFFYQRRNPVIQLYFLKI